MQINQKIRKKFNKDIFLQCADLVMNQSTDPQWFEKVVVAQRAINLLQLAKNK